MALYDVTDGSHKARLIDPQDVADSEYIAVLKRKLHALSYQRIIKTAEEAVESIVRSGDQKLVWTKAGALFGHNSIQPKKHIDHLWNYVTTATGDGKECLIAVGCLLRWTIARRPETWLLWAEETDNVDPDTGKKIKISQYWIDNTFQVPKPKVVNSVDTLKSKWGAR